MTRSLRMRLTLIVLLPLLAIGAAVAIWQVAEARATAGDLFDRRLLSAALAVSGDVERSNGNALSLQTTDLLADSSGGPVFYHAYAPDGIYVLGYATPPVPENGLFAAEGGLAYYNGRYHSRDVRVLRFQSDTTVDDVSGLFTYTVWQDVAVRNAFVRERTGQTFAVIAVLIGSVALVVWFGIGLGLRPLLDLEDAISRRSSDDLRPIRRAVPAETQGLVSRLNSLFRQVEQAMEAQTTLISNAAHQLRNPIAGVLAMAEAVHDAPTDAAARTRARGVLDAARQASALADKLLTLERIRAAPQSEFQMTIDLAGVARTVAEQQTPEAAAAGVALQTDISPHAISVVADEVMVGEAIANLVDNALKHGGPDLRTISLGVAAHDGMAVVTVADDGVGLDPADVDTVLARFGQAAPSDGSGLGLSIALAVAERHGGSLQVDTDRAGLAVSLNLPQGADVTDAQRAWA
jgi:two-component system sensor histidine kinase TctE